MRRAVALAAVALLAGCGGTARPEPRPTAAATATPPRPPSARELITQVLARRARHIGTRQRRLGLVRPHYVTSSIRVHGRRARITTRLAYGVRGVRGDFGSQRTLIAVRRHRRWRVVRALGSRDADPWETGDYVRTSSAHFVVLTPRDVPAPTGALEGGYAQLEQALRHSRLRRRYLAVVARDGGTARRLTRVIEGVDNLTALTDTQLAAGRRIASQRLIIVQNVFAAATPKDQQTVVTHELTHAALAGLATGRTPAWLIEGTALYVSGDDRRPEYASLPKVPTLAGLSVPEAIARLTGDTQRAAYATSSAAAFLLAERYGPNALLELYRAFARPGPRRGSAAYDDRILRRVLRTSLDKLQRTLA